LPDGCVKQVHQHGDASPLNGCIKHCVEGSSAAEICSGSKAGSYLRLIDFVYHSTLRLRVIKKRRSAAGVSSGEGKTYMIWKKLLQENWLKPRSESGLDCRICSLFARQEGLQHLQGLTCSTNSWCERGGGRAVCQRWGGRAMTLDSGTGHGKPPCGGWVAVDLGV